MKKLETKRPDTTRRTFSILIPVAAVLAIAGALFWRSNRPRSRSPAEIESPPGTAPERPKGFVEPQPGVAVAHPVDPTAELLQLYAADGGPALAPRPGDQLELRFAPGSYHLALVVGIDQRQRISVLWPSGGSKSAPLAGVEKIGVRATLGSLRIVAAFSNEPITAKIAATGLPHPGVEARELTLAPR